jgi:NAD(P)-dependent dehydrogenase (short-subunit alcohol dehydrogenase family)
MNLEIKNRVAIVCGASKGMGFSCAQTLALEGVKVLMIARDEKALSEATRKIGNEGGTVEAYAGDVSDSNLPNLAVSRCEALWGGVDILINNAGINITNTVKFIKTDQLDQILDINVKIPILLTKEILKAGKLNNFASVVFTASIAGVYRTSMGNSMYSAAKAAIHGFMRNAALEMANQKIRVNSVNPGMIDTELVGKGNITDELYEADRLKYPLKRYGKAQEVSWAIIYLLSDASAWTTGTAMVIDGGITLR